MTFSSAHTMRAGSADDIVAARDRLVMIGMVAVWVACVSFGIARLVITLGTGRLTPWWVNVAGALALPALYVWYRRQPLARSSGAANGAALVATLALLVPVAYGMTSTVWWLSLVGFAMVLLGRRGEAWIWGVGIPLLVVATSLVEPWVQLRGSAGEPPIERGLARFIFVVLLVGMAAAFRVVTEQRARALHDSDERYRMLFQRVPAGVFHCDNELLITDCNERFAALAGGDRESLAGVAMGSLISGCALPAIQDALRGAQGAYEGPCTGPAGGAEVLVSIRTVPVQGKDGSIGGALGIVEDVTDSRRMGRELQRSHDGLEQRVRERTAELQRSRGVIANILNSIPQGVFWKDTNSAYLGCNAVFARAAGLLSPEDIVGKNDSDLPWCDLAEAYRADDREVIKTGLPRRGIIRSMRYPDGPSAWISTTSVPLTDETDAVFGVLGVFEDITERKRAEEVLRLSNAYNRTLIETSLDPLVTISPEGRITDVNRATEMATGVRRDLIVGTDFSDYFTEPEKARQGYRKVLAEGSVVDYPLTIRHPDGHTMDVLYAASVFRNETGDVRGVFAAARDITERKRAEERLQQQAAELKARNEELIRFNDAAVGRELRMITLKQQVNDLCLQLGRAQEYPLGFLETGAPAPIATPDDNGQGSTGGTQAGPDGGEPL